MEPRGLRHLACLTYATYASKRTSRGSSPSTPASADAHQVLISASGTPRATASSTPVSLIAYATY